MKNEEIEALKRENEYLKELLRQHNISFDLPKIVEEKDYSEDEKLSLYLNYFNGRQDIFAFQYVSKEGRKGCSPCCENRPNLTGYCPNKCSECTNKKYATLTKVELKRHLIGKDIFGIYPLLDNDYCNLLAFDFDDEDFKESSLGFSRICKEFNLDNLIEISQSGNGSHVWLFFDHPIKALKARRMGSLLLLKARDTYKGINFKSLDRMFPSQDYLPNMNSGYGNLIILPLNGNKAKENKTIFVDDNFIPFSLKMQFNVLSSTKKISEEIVDKTIETLQPYQNVFKIEGKNLEMNNIKKQDFGFDLKIVETNYLSIPKSNLNVRSRKFLERISSLPNPEYYKLEKQRRNLYKVNRILSLYREDDNYIYIPRGCKDALIKALNFNEVEYEIESKVNNGKKTDVEFLGKLNESQIDGFNKLITSDTGIFVAPPGYGKTVLAIYLISELKRSTLVIVDSINLMNQWKARLSSFLKVNYPYKKTKDMFGQYCGSKKKLNGFIDIASMDSLNSDEGLSILSNYGLVIVDEVHHAGAQTYERVIRNISSKYLYGFTATPKRSDNNERVIFRLIGDIKYKYNGEYNKDLRKILYPTFTTFSFTQDEREMPYSDIITALLKDEDRNNLIIDNINEAIKKDKNILVLTDRVEHVDLLYEKLKSKKNVFKIFGSSSAKDKNNLLEKLSTTDENFTLISTGKLLGEGFDNKKLNCLFLVSPFKWSGTLEQYVGRLHRPDENKVEVEVHDFIDLNVYIFENMYHKRLSGYKKLNYQINDSSFEDFKHLYTATDYKEALIDDILKSKREIIFNVGKFDNELFTLLDACKKVSIFSRENFEHKNINGFSTTNCLANMIIIDNTIIWYGGINPFVTCNYENTIMRICNKSLIKTITNNILKKTK